MATLNYSTNAAPAPKATAPATQNKTATTNSKSNGGGSSKAAATTITLTDPEIVGYFRENPHLDADTTVQILDLLQQLNRQLDVTLLMVTHDADAAKVAGRQIRLDHGKLSEVGTG